MGLDLTDINYGKIGAITSLVVGGAYVMQKIYGATEQKVTRTRDLLNFTEKDTLMLFDVNKFLDDKGDYILEQSNVMYGILNTDTVGGNLFDYGMGNVTSSWVLTRTLWELVQKTLSNVLGGGFIGTGVINQLKNFQVTNPSGLMNVVDSIFKSMSPTALHLISTYLYKILLEYIKLTGTYRFPINPIRVSKNYTKKQTFTDTGFGSGILEGYGDQWISYNIDYVTQPLIPPPILRYALGIKDIRLSIPYLMFKAFEDFYKKNNSYLIIYFQGEFYIGYFTKFSYNIDSADPYVIKYNIGFNVHPYIKWSVMEYNAPGISTQQINMNPNRINWDLLESNVDIDNILKKENTIIQVAVSDDDGGYKVMPARNWSDISDIIPIG